MKSIQWALSRGCAAAVTVLALAACGGGSSTTATDSASGSTDASIASTTSLLPVIDTTKLPAAAAGWSGARLQSTTLTTDAADIGAFRLGCFYSHMKFDDPIVYPGQAGVSHLHVFFGNTGADANSTNDTIANSGNSTCSGGTLNRSAYWVPAMIDTTDGTPITPSAILVYYKTGYGGVKPADVRAVPTGLRMIAGNSKATTATSDGAGRFSCVGGSTGVGWQSSIPTTCNTGNSLIMEISFPQCWDGVNLDSPDHKSHVASPTGSGCPAAYPVALPAITYEVYYDLSAVVIARMAKWRLSSDNYAATTAGGYSAHGDYVFGWDAATMQTFITNCDNASVDCHANLLGNGTMLY